MKVSGSLKRIGQRVPTGVKRWAYEIVDAVDARVRRVRVNEAPVFVLGAHKAGTTAIAMLLGKLTGLEVAPEMRLQIAAPQYREVLRGALPIDAFVHRNRVAFSRDIIKENHLTFLHPQLTERFPEARFVMVVREPRANIRSILDRVRLPGNLERPPANALRGVNPGWRDVLDNDWLGIEPDHYIVRLAEFWNRAADVYLGAAAAMSLIRYEDFCRDKAGSLRHLAAELDLPATGDIVADADRQFQPRGSHRGTSLEAFFGAENEARIRETCAARMSALGYAAQAR